MSKIGWRERLAPFAAGAWHRGQLMAWSGVDGSSPTDYEGGLVIRTVVEPAGLEIVYPASGRIDFTHPPQGAIIIANDFFSFGSDIGPIAGCLLDAHHLLIVGAVSVSGADETICHLSQGNRSLIGLADHFDAGLIEIDIEAAMAARSQWLIRQPLLDTGDLTTRRTVYRALSVMKGQVSLPEGAIHHRWTTPDRWPHKDMWLWDSVFHAIGWRHVDHALARDMIAAVFDGQKADGFIPHQMSPTRQPSGHTQPPILAFGIKMVNDIAPDLDWIRIHYPKLSAYLNWDFANRDTDGDGLVEWRMEGESWSRSGESGMDNSPRFDFHYPTRLAAVDFNAYLATECEVMAGFAHQLGHTADVTLWQERYDALCQRINASLWSEADQFYSDYDSSRGVHSPVLASAGFLPLLCGAATPARAAILARHLQDPAMFATAFPVPSIAVRDRAHYAKDMWRGPTWIAINWFIARGLERYAPSDAGFLDQARALDIATIAEIERTCEKFGTFFEYFDDRREVEPPQLLRKGICDPSNPFRQVIHDYGWTTTLYIDLVVRQRKIAR